MKNAINAGHKKISKIMLINNDETKIGKRIRDVLDSCMEIDGQGGLKRQRLDSHDS